MMVDPMLMIIQNSILFLPAVTPTAVPPTGHFVTFSKGLLRQCLIALAGAGINDVWNKGFCSLFGSKT